MEFRKPFAASEYRGGEQMACGTHVVTLTKEEVRQSKAGDDMLVLEFRAQDGAEIAHFLNLWHRNKMAASISARHLAKICDAAGIALLRRSEDLLGKRFTIKVSEQQNSATGETYRRIVKFEPAPGASDRAAQGPLPAAAAPPHQTHLSLIHI